MYVLQFTRGHEDQCRMCRACCSLRLGRTLGGTEEDLQSGQPERNDSRGSSFEAAVRPSVYGITPEDGRIPFGCRIHILHVQRQ